MNSDDLYVWIYLPSSTTPVLAGRLNIDQSAAKSVGTFIYGKHYLANSAAIPIDPVALPLEKKEFKFTSLSGYPGVIVDACPDRWGIKIIDRLYGKGSHPLNYLLKNDPGRSGCLAFSSSRDEPPVELQSREFSLSDLLKAADDVENNREIDEELLKALHPGTGGARPKCNIEKDGAIWIAKFPSMGDAAYISGPRLEHASMELARACGLNVAETHLQVVGGKDVCIVKRFDREGVNANARRISYISARSVFYADPAYESVGTGSYYRLARWLPRYGGAFAQKVELFRRMVFNCAIRNSDDHELNHGLIRSADGTYSLSPAFDVLPVLNSNKVHSHALLIGDDAYGTIENLISNSKDFDLDRSDALSIIANIQSAIKAQWQDVFYTAGFGDEDIRNVEELFKPIPERR